jgi:hypothetical protein
MNTPLPPKRDLTPDQQIFVLILTFPCLANRAQPWLNRATEFDPEHFHSLFARASTLESLCSRFVLNVWNTHYARAKGWNFDLYAFMTCADAPSRAALLHWLRHPDPPYQSLAGDQR